MDPSLRPVCGSSLLIRWMRSRSPRSIFGRPALFRDFQRQNGREARAVPAKDGLRLNHLGTPASRPGQSRVIPTEQARDH